MAPPSRLISTKRYFSFPTMTGSIDEMSGHSKMILPSTPPVSSNPTSACAGSSSLSPLPCAFAFVVAGDTGQKPKDRSTTFTVDFSLAVPVVELVLALGDEDFALLALGELDE